MPYKTNKDLPERVRKHIPARAQTIFREAYNNAHKQYHSKSKRRGNDSLTAICNKVAWTAVKRKYKKLGDKWVEI